MPYDPENPFGDLEDTAKGVDAAGPAMSTGRLPVFANYKGVCTVVDLKGDGVMVDKEIFETKAGTKGLKIFIEILEPETVEGTKVKGEIHEHVFFVTEGMIPYLKRDVPIILNRPWVSMAQFAKEKWAGATVEFGLRDDAYQGFVRSKVSYFAPWTPNQEKAGAGQSAPAKGAPETPAKGASAPAKGASSSAPRKDVAKGAASKVDF